MELKIDQSTLKIPTEEKDIAVHPLLLEVKIPTDPKTDVEKEIKVPFLETCKLIAQAFNKHKTNYQIGGGWIVDLIADQLGIEPITDKPGDVDVYMDEIGGAQALLDSEFYLYHTMKNNWREIKEVDDEFPVHSFAKHPDTKITVDLNCQAINKNRFQTDEQLVTLVIDGIAINTIPLQNIYGGLQKRITEWTTEHGHPSNTDVNRIEKLEQIFERFEKTPLENTHSSG